MDPRIPGTITRLGITRSMNAKYPLESEVPLALAEAAKQADQAVQSGRLPMRDEQAIERAIKAKGKTGPRLTPELIDAQIEASFSFTALDALAALGVSVPERAKPSLAGFTLALIVARNGYVTTGESAPADPSNFDREIGVKIAVGNARNKLWPLCGWSLRNRLADLPA